MKVNLDGWSRKMIKAIEILNKKILSLERHITIFGTGKNEEFDNVIQKELDEVNEAVQELEALKYRTCDTCELNSYLDCPCWDYSNGKPCITYYSEWEAKVV